MAQENRRRTRRQIRARDAAEGEKTAGTSKKASKRKADKTTPADTDKITENEAAAGTQSQTVKEEKEWHRKHWE